VAWGSNGRIHSVRSKSPLANTKTVIENPNLGKSEAKKDYQRRRKLKMKICVIFDNNPARWANSWLEEYQNKKATLPGG
jgi:hypothetical protein